MARTIGSSAATHRAGPSSSSPAMHRTSNSSPAQPARPFSGVRPGQLSGKSVLSSQSVRNAPSRSGKDGRGFGGGKGVARMRRHRKIMRDNIQGITKSDIRRMARRGGVKRISGTVYEETRHQMKKHLEDILKIAVEICDYQQRKTVTVTDIIFALRRIGRPIYGFGDAVKGRRLGPD